MDKLFIFTPHITPRLEYVVLVCTKHLSHLQVELTDNPDFFKAISGIKWSYGQWFEDTFCMYADGLLWENNIVSQYWYTQEGFLFRSKDDCGRFHVGYDIFSAIFYLVSRYEEYLTQPLDIHGRIPANQQLLVKLGWHHKAVVHDYWQFLLEASCTFFGYHLKAQLPAYTSKMSFDIDHPFEFLHKPFLLNLYGFLEDATQKKFSDFSRRFFTLRKKMIDRYYTFDYIFRKLQEYKKEHIWFILNSRQHPLDSKHTITHKAYQKLIQKIIKNSGEIGLHASYLTAFPEAHFFISNIATEDFPEYTSKYPFEKLCREKAELEQYLPHLATKNRQHFLRMQLPYTYQKLMEAGILEDYSMGYFDETGFRAGIAVPYPFFDLTKNSIHTNFMIYPLLCMDVSMQQYLKYTPEQAITISTNLIEEVKRVNGCFISLWHNSNLHNEEEWKGWQAVFEHQLSRM